MSVPLSMLINESETCGLPNLHILQSKHYMHVYYDYTYAEKKARFNQSLFFPWGAGGKGSYLAINCIAYIMLGTHWSIMFVISDPSSYLHRRYLLPKTKKGYLYPQKKIIRRATGKRGELDNQLHCLCSARVPLQFYFITSDRSSYLFPSTFA